MPFRLSELQESNPQFGAQLAKQWPRYFEERKLEQAKLGDGSMDNFPPTGAVFQDSFENSNIVLFAKESWGAAPAAS